MIYRWFIIICTLALLPVHLLAQQDEFKITEIKTIDTFEDYVREVRFSPFGNYFAATSGVNRVFLYNRDYQLLWSSQGEIMSVGGKVAFSPDEKYLAFTRYKTKGDIGVLSIDELRVVQSMDAHPHYVNSIAYSPDGVYLATAGSEKMVIVWRWNGKEFEKLQVLEGHEKTIDEVRFSPDGRYIASCGDDKQVIIWEFKGDRFVQDQKLVNDTYWLDSLAFSPDGKLLATGSSSKLSIWKLEGGKFSINQEIKHSAGGLWSLEFSPDGRFLAAAISNGTVKVWVVTEQGWRETLNVYRHNDNVFDASFRSDGKLFATASSDMTAIFWELEGVAPDPVMALMDSLGLPFTVAQKLIVDRPTSKRIIKEIDPHLAAPKDEFETTEQYLMRKEKLSSHLLLKLQNMTEEHFKVKKKKKEKQIFELSFTLDSLEEYDADNQIYHIKLLGTDGYVNLSPLEARDLKRNKDKTLLSAEKKLSDDGVSYDYSGFVLKHPVNNRTYEIALHENPFRGELIERTAVATGGESFIGAVEGPNVILEDVEFGAVFPVFYKYYDENPIGKAVLRNSGTVPVENIRVGLFIKQYMDNPKLCEAPTELDSGQKGELILYGLFTNRVMEISEGNKVSVKITVDYIADGKPHSQEFIDTIRIHNRNAITWDDDQKVAAFVTAKDPVVLKFSKNTAGMIKGKTSRALNSNLLMAIALHRALSLYGMSYVIDPTTPYREFSRSDLAVDFLQFPKQTLEYRAGDCDDLSILYNALLESVGINTAFITIPGHILTAFSLDMTAEEAKNQFENEADFIFVDGIAWMPVEITVIDDGFLKAWQMGAKEWRESSKQEKARFYSTEDAWAVYEPVGLFGTADISLPSSDHVVEEYIDEVNKLISREIFSREQKLKNDLKNTGESPKLLNKLGVLYARYGLEQKAIETFEKILALEDYTPALMNIGNIYYLQNDMKNAMLYYERALKKEPKNARIYVALTRVYQNLEKYEEAGKLYSKLKKIDSGLAERFSYLGTAEEGSGRAALAGGMHEKMLWEE
ncbi:MAG: tetratricopeptide repeat protein [Spirochaetota bacterium]|nr:MAG: tetratricopeptide repeat protein [Spirochaetota bacterium]